MGTTTQKTFKIIETITCSSSFVIYLISCPCGLQCISKTNCQLKTRINEHRSSIRRMDIHSPVARHFADVDHKLSDMRFLGIQRLTSSRRGGDSNKTLLQCESKWIHHMDCIYPKGLNEELQLSCFL